MPPVRLKVVDTQDSSPVAGAHILFLGAAQEGTLTGHGGRTANLCGVETRIGSAGAGGTLSLSARAFVVTASGMRSPRSSARICVTVRRMRGTGGSSGVS
jgi:hypothetical protein